MSNHNGNGSALVSPSEPFAPDEMPEAEWNLREAVRLNQEVDRRRIRWEASKEETSELKKALEAAQDELNGFLKRVNEELPLFDKKG